jgi:hypothetical protein
LAAIPNRKNGGDPNLKSFQGRGQAQGGFLNPKIGLKNGAGPSDKNIKANRNDSGEKREKGGMKNER